ncbi:hypothetical protein OS493_023203 [Desmophyllum pertusum]|uniref:Uncharacterized protein n=1 Tax=Desmophyllum pertusum TaxID=174260 RepID=A0A9W9YQ95_9CNID|nr:hypothetical protein OS493_023203 [Desmophyllum pertusum]
MASIQTWVDDKGMLCPICETRFMCTKALCVPRRKNLPRQNDVLDYFPKVLPTPVVLLICYLIIGKQQPIGNCISAEAQPL